MKNEAIYTQWMSHRTPDPTQHGSDRHQLDTPPPALSFWQAGQSCITSLGVVLIFFSSTKIGSKFSFQSSIIQTRVCPRLYQKSLSPTISISKLVCALA